MSWHGPLLKACALNQMACTVVRRNTMGRPVYTQLDRQQQQRRIRWALHRCSPFHTVCSTNDMLHALRPWLMQILLNTRRSPDMDSNDKLLNMLSRLRDGNAADTEATGFAPATATDTTATYETPTHGGEGAAAGGRDAQAGAGQQGSEGRSIASSAYLASNENNIGAANDAAITNSTGSTTSSSSTSASMSPRQRLASYLAATHTWFDRYASDHPGVAMRVLMEDMFTPGVGGGHAGGRVGGGVGARQGTVCKRESARVPGAEGRGRGCRVRGEEHWGERRGWSREGAGAGRYVRAVGRSWLAGAWPCRSCKGGRVCSEQGVGERVWG